MGGISKMPGEVGIIKRWSHPSGGEPTKTVTLKAAASSTGYVKQPGRTITVGARCRF